MSIETTGTIVIGALLVGILLVLHAGLSPDEDDGGYSDTQSRRSEE